MGSRDQNLLVPVPKGFQDAERRLGEFFESRLQKMGLGMTEINRYALEELEQSLEIVNDALLHPENFGYLNIKLTADAGTIIGKTSAESHFQLGIASLLLERKNLIRNRIRALKSDEKIKEKIPNESDREKLLAELDSRLNDTDENTLRVWIENGTPIGARINFVNLPEEILFERVKLYLKKIDRSREDEKLNREIKRSTRTTLLQGIGVGAGVLSAILGMLKALGFF